MADDGLYTKMVARRMLQMTRHINTDWKQHVANTGVTCWTCHRGNAVPTNIWFKDNGAPHAGGFASTNFGMGHPNKANGLTDLHQDPFSPLLEGAETIRVAATQALPTTGAGQPIFTTERTYSLMIHMSEALGVNCTFCHNSRWLRSSGPLMTTGQRCDRHWQCGSHLTESFRSLWCGDVCDAVTASRMVLAKDDAHVGGLPLS